jgi:hypothetical protein
VCVCVCWGERGVGGTVREAEKLKIVLNFMTPKVPRLQREKKTINSDSRRNSRCLLYIRKQIFCEQY